MKTESDKKPRASASKPNQMKRHRADDHHLLAKATPQQGASTKEQLALSQGEETEGAAVATTNLTLPPPVKFRRPNQPTRISAGQQADLERSLAYELLKLDRPQPVRRTVVGTPQCPSSIETGPRRISVVATSTDQMSQSPHNYNPATSIALAAAIASASSLAKAVEHSPIKTDTSAVGEADDADSYGELSSSADESPVKRELDRTIDGQLVYTNSLPLVQQSPTKNEVPLTRSELSVLQKRREHYFRDGHQDERTTLVLIDREEESLRCIQYRCEELGCTDFETNEYVARTKQMIVELYLTLLRNMPTDESHWTRFEAFCERFAVCVPIERLDSVCRSIIDTHGHLSPDVFRYVTYCTLNLTGDHFSLCTNYLHRALELFPTNVDLNLTYLELFIIRCFQSRVNRSRTGIECSTIEPIVSSKHLFDVYKNVRKRIELFESNCNRLLAVAQVGVEACPCKPVFKLQSMIVADVDKCFPSNASLVDAKARQLLARVNLVTLQHVLFSAFELFHNAFLASKRSATVFDKFVQFFQSLPSESPIVQKLLAIIFELGYASKVLFKSEYSTFWLNQLMRIKNARVTDNVKWSMFNKVLSQLSDSAPGSTIASGASSSSSSSSSGGTSNDVTGTSSSAAVNFDASTDLALMVEFRGMVTIFGYDETQMRQCLSRLKSKTQLLKCLRGCLYVLPFIVAHLDLKAAADFVQNVVECLTSSVPNDELKTDPELVAMDIRARLVWIHCLFNAPSDSYQKLMELQEKYPFLAK